MPGQVEEATPRKEISHEWVLIIGGVISIFLGVVLVANPAAGIVKLTEVKARKRYTDGRHHRILVFTRRLPSP
jgi:hypothetical protein